MSDWVSAFLITEVIEVTLGMMILSSYCGSCDAAPHSRQRAPMSHLFNLRVWSSLCLASAITHPPFWFVLPVLLKGLGVTSFLAYVVIGETLVIVVEAWWYQQTLKRFRGDWRTSSFFASILNLASAMTGLALSRAGLL
jgi:hypothetical protein